VNNGEELAEDRDRWMQLAIVAMDLNSPGNANE